MPSHEWAANAGEKDGRTAARHAGVCPLQLPTSLWRAMCWAGAALGVCLLIIAGLLITRWPFSYDKIHPMLENVFASNIEIQQYHRTFFPSPGFVAHGLTMRRRSAGPDVAPLATAETLAVRGSWADLLLLRRHVDAVDVERFRLMVPAPGTRERKEDFPQGSSHSFTGPETSIGKLTFDDASIEIGRRDAATLIFPVHRLLLRNFHRGDAVRFDVEMDNAKPRGRIHAHGSFGPLLPGHLRETAIDGDFTAEHVRLDDIGKLHGDAELRGHFSHTLGALQTEAHAATRNFSEGEGRPIPASADIRCTINVRNGDVELRDVHGVLGRTPVRMHGSITGAPKIARIDLVVDHGRAQDLMQPFVHDRAPIVGGVSLHGHAEVLPGAPGRKFLDRLVMQGSFDVPNEKLTNPSTEESLSAFSERARKDPEAKHEPETGPDVDVLSSFEAPFTLRDAVVTTSRARFVVQGASADLHGTYNLRSKDVHLTGNLNMQASLSHVTTGFKSALLKPFSIFFHHKDAEGKQEGAVFPIAVTGKPGSYRVTGNLLHTK